MWPFKKKVKEEVKEVKEIQLNKVYSLLTYNSCVIPLETMDDWVKYRTWYIEKKIMVGESHYLTIDAFNRMYVLGIENPFFKKED